MIHAALMIAVAFLATAAAPATPPSVTVISQVSLCGALNFQVNLDDVLNDAPTMKIVRARIHV
jgi:hypothetical protein